MTENKFLKPGSQLELQSIKVASLTGMIMLGYVSYLTISGEHTFELAWVNYLTIAAPITVFLFCCYTSYALIISVDNERNSRNYPLFLMVFIVLGSLFFFIMNISQIANATKVMKTNFS